MPGRLRALDKTIDYRDKTVCEPLNIDVVMQHDVWQQYTVTEQDEEQSEYLGLAKVVGNEEMTFFPHDIELQIYDIPRYPHTINGTGGTETKYACIKGREPSEHSLLPWDRNNWTPWSYHVKSDVSRGKHGYRSGYKAIVYRNNKVWMETWRSARDAARLWCEMTIDSFENNFYGPDLNLRDWEQKLIGTNFGYKGEIYTVDCMLHGQAAIITVEPYAPEELDEALKIEMNTKEIDWFPTVTQQHILRKELLLAKRNEMEKKLTIHGSKGRNRGV
jgi:hypothetical protein